jgi:hypothetical protein
MDIIGQSESIHFRGSWRARFPKREWQSLQKETVGRQNITPTLFHKCRPGSIS